MKLDIINTPPANRLKRVDMRLTFAANAVRPTTTPPAITLPVRNAIYGCLLVSSTIGPKSTAKTTQHCFERHQLFLIIKRFLVQFA